MNTRDYFDTHEGRLIDKWAHYFPIYDRYFSRFRDRTHVHVLEIGVNHGGSLELWRDYFGAGALVTGVDIDERCTAYAGGNISVFLYDQSSAEEMHMLGFHHGPFDIIIDDGSHVLEHQETSFKALWPYLSDGGVYLIEDIHGTTPPRLEAEPRPYSCALYPWVTVLEKGGVIPERVVRGKPSRPLNAAELAAYKPMGYTE